jgi:hypothetical protein
MFASLRTASLLLLIALGLSGCGYNEFQRLDEQVKAGWSEVVNQYQRRADLIPNIVAEYIVLARSIPSNLTAMAMAYLLKPNFAVQNEAEIAAPPTVSFGKPAAK